MSDKPKKRKQLAHDICVLADDMDNTADMMMDLAYIKHGHRYVTHAGELRGAASMAREWAKEIREGT